MNLIGKSPIPAALLILGKLAMFFCWIFFIVKITGSAKMIYDNTVISMVGITIIFIGIAFAILGIVNLGDSIAVGLREDETRLKTHGVYAISRNPIYFGAFLMCIGSCLYALHIINIILLLITIVIHHNIILKEEIFLEGKFRRHWVEYRNKVYRYFGRKDKGE